MMKSILFAFFCLSQLHAEREIILISIKYAEQKGPQGDYLLSPGKDGLVSLKSIGGRTPLPDVKPQEIVSTLTEAYPSLAGKISVSHLKIDTDKLLEKGLVHVLGQVENDGHHAAETLDDCLAKAKPTRFGALKRIQLIRDGELHLHDAEGVSRAHPLMPGDIVLVPMKRVIGR